MRGKMLFGAASAALLIGLGIGPAAAQSSDPPGDNSTQARLATNGSVNGEISPAADQDWFRLGVRTGQRYTISLDAAGGEAPLDPVLTLYGADGEQIVMNDDAGGTLNSQIIYTPTSNSDVFVGAGGFLDESTGAYRLSVTEADIPPDNAGNDATTRARAAAGRPINGALEYEGDVDWFRFNARTGNRYRIALNGAESGEALSDPLLRIVGSDGQEIAINDDSEVGLNSLLEFTPQSSGDVFIEAGAFGGQATGAYTLSIEAERMPTDSASGDRNTRARINLGQPVGDSIGFVGDVDWRRVRLEEGQSYRFALNSDTESDTPITDPVLRLYNSEGEEVAVDDDGGAGFNSYLEYTAPTTGTYFVEARSFAEDGTGAYTLWGQAGDIPADTSTDATLDPAGDYREAVLSPAGDKDWYAINLAEGQGLRLAVSSAETGDALGDPYIVLRGPDGAEMVQDDDGGEGLNSFLEFSAPAAGTYFLEVRGFVEQEAQGRYTIQLTPGEIGADAENSEYLNTAGEGRTSSIGPAGDVDWFAVDLIEGRPYRFNLESDQSEGGLDPVLTLHNEQGEQIATDDDGGMGTNAYITHVSTTGGRYYLAASGFNNESVGMYMLRVSDTDVPGRIETDEALADGDDRLSRIDMPGDLDTYRVELEAGARYTIEVSGEGDNPLADPFVAILDMNSERLTSDDDSGPGLDARVRFTPETGGMFFIQASGLGGSTGWYKVTLTRE